MTDEAALAVLPSLLSSIACNGDSLGQILAQQRKAHPKIEGLISEISIILSIVSQLEKLFSYEADVGPFSETILQDAVRTSDQCAGIFTKLQQNFEQRAVEGKGNVAAVRRKQISWLVVRNVFSDLLDQLRKHRVCFTNLLTYLTDARISNMLKTRKDTNMKLMGIVASSKTSNADLHHDPYTELLIRGLQSTTETASERTIPDQNLQPNQSYGKDDLPHLSRLEAALNLVQADVRLTQKMVGMRQYAPSLPLVASLEQLAPLLKPLLRDRSTIASRDAPSTVRESTDLLLGILTKSKREDESGSDSDSSSTSSDSSRSRRHHRRFRRRCHITRSSSTSSASSDTSSSSGESFISVALPRDSVVIDPVHLSTDTLDAATSARTTDLPIPEPPYPIYPPGTDMAFFDHGINYCEDDRTRSDLSQLDKIAFLLSKIFKLKHAAAQLEAASERSPFGDDKLAKLENAIKALCDRQMRLSTAGKQSTGSSAETERHNWSVVWDVDDLVFNTVQELPSRYRPFWPSRGDAAFNHLVFPPMPLPPMNAIAGKKKKKGRFGRLGDLDAKGNEEVMKQTGKKLRKEFKAALETNKKDLPDLSGLSYEDLTERWTT